MHRGKNCNIGDDIAEIPDYVEECKAAFVIDTGTCWFKRPSCKDDIHYFRDDTVVYIKI